MSRFETKTQRLAQIEALLMENPHGLTQSQIAQRLGVNRSTISRNLVDLSAPVYEENGRIFIDRESYLVNLHLTLHEALVVHLAGRLMATSLDRRNPHAAAAFRKLGLSLERLAPGISRFVCASAGSFDDDSKVQDPRYLQVLEKLTLAWAKGQNVQIWYRAAGSPLVKEYLFSPYFIEVNAVGQAIYSIGRIEPEDELRTFKLERVERIELASSTFSPPPGFDPEKMLGQAWGIWFTDQEPVKVVLKFSPRAAKRVAETRWHFSEQQQVQPDGSLLWSARIAEPREMMPWVRGWGADCEVLAPPEMRAEVCAAVEQMAKIYAGGAK
jgi:predicted DNA-binding transcriptional regulator YafY